MIKFDFENLAKNLPDYYSKDTDSNNYKILQIEKSTISKIKKDMSDIDTALDLSEAYGDTLDLYGDMIGVSRGNANDYKYRYMIKAKIMQNLSGGNHNSVINSISMVFGCDVSEVVIQDAMQPATVEMLSVPLDIIERAELTQGEIVDTVSNLLPAGVSVNTFLFAGTFEFAENENVASDTTGFANDEQTIGGHFGNIAS